MRAGDRFVATYEVECQYFSERRCVPGEDSVQALLRLPMATHAALLAREQRGFEVFQYKPGDLGRLGFWGTTRLTFDPDSGPHKCSYCGGRRFDAVNDNMDSAFVAAMEGHESEERKKEARPGYAEARRQRMKPGLCNQEIASRVLHLREPDGVDTPLIVRFFAPEPDPDHDFRAEFSLEHRDFSDRKSLYGVDPIQALLFTPAIAHVLLLNLEAQGCTVFHRAPGDLHDPNFWGVRRFTYDGDRPNICDVCREQRPVPPEVAEEQRALLSAVSDWDGP